MLLSSVSLKLINNTFNTLKRCYKPYSPREQKGLNNFMDTMYKNIYDGYNYVNNAERDIKRQKINIANYGVTKKPTMWGDLESFPDKIKRYILNETHIELIYTLTINGKLISLHFFTYKDEKQIEEYAKMAYIWFYILSLYSLERCSKDVNIYIYLTNFNKETLVEKHAHHQHHQHHQQPIKPGRLTTYNVNTAYTTNGCTETSEIIIYRKEEWFKVLIHETFHNFEMDFSDINSDILREKIKSIFLIKSEYNIYETYCEAWARILNSQIASFLLLKNKQDRDLFLEYSNIFLQLERIFSLYQCYKMLEFYDLTMVDLYNPQKSIRFDEATNAFAYYVLVSALMNNYVDFIKWSAKNNVNILRFNKSPENLIAFGNMIAREMARLKTTDDFKCISEIKFHIPNTARMSIIEVDILLNNSCKKN